MRVGGLEEGKGEWRKGDEGEKKGKRKGKKKMEGRRGNTCGKERRRGEEEEG